MCPLFIPYYGDFFYYLCHYIYIDLYRGGELLDELEAIGCFQEDDAALLLLHMLTCINYLHEQNYAHRDLKPENILLEENMKLDDSTYSIYFSWGVGDESFCL